MAQDKLILALYQKILDDSRTMLDMAKQEEWDALVDREMERRKQVVVLRTKLESQPEALSPAAMEQAQNLVKETLALDEETRRLVNVWMLELDQKLGSINTSRRLQNTYLAP